MQMPGRDWNTFKYRFSINGQEKSPEITENSTSALFWEYTANIARRWNLDPKSTVGVSAYSVFDNSPIYRNDILGDSSSVVGNVDDPKPVKIGHYFYYRFRYLDFVKRYPDKDPPTYYLEYGDKYLRRFVLKTKATLSPEGKLWLDKALIYLQDEMENKVLNQKPGEESVENDNKKFTDFAFGTHVKAYEKAGVLSLSVMDKVKILLTPDAKDLFSDRGLDQAKNISAHLYFYYLFNPKTAIKHMVEVKDNIGTIRQMVHKYYIENKSFFEERAKKGPYPIFQEKDAEYRIMDLINGVIPGRIIL